jgi:hypothetical protein
VNSIKPLTSSESLRSADGVAAASMIQRKKYLYGQRSSEFLEVQILTPLKTHK